jgi:hypothetical protein
VFFLFVNMINIDCIWSNIEFLEVLYFIEYSSIIIESSLKDFYWFFDEIVMVFVHNKI